MQGLLISAELLLIIHLVIGLPAFIAIVHPLVLIYLTKILLDMVGDIVWVVIARCLYPLLCDLNGIMFDVAKFILKLVVDFIVKPFVQKGKLIFNFTCDFLFFQALKAMNFFDFRLKTGTYLYNISIRKLHEAVKQAQINKVNLLLELGVNINEIANNGYGIRENALSLAVIRGNIDFTVFLLEKGASFETVPGDLSLVINRIVMNYAAGSPELFKKLLDKMPEASIDAYVKWAGIGTVVSHYRNTRLTESVFESVLNLAKKMHQTDKGWGDARFIKNLLTFMKPGWCSEMNFQMLLDNATNKVFTNLDKMYKKRAKAARAQVNDTQQANTEVPQPSEPVLPSLVQLPEPAEVLQFRQASQTVVSSEVAANDAAEPVMNHENNIKASLRA